MSLLAQRLRTDANELLEAAEVLSLEKSLRLRLLSLLEITEIRELREEIQAMADGLPNESDSKNQTALIVASVNAHTNKTIADMVESQDGFVRIEDRLSRKETVANFQHQIRKAASAGDYQEYDRLVREHFEQINNSPRARVPDTVGSNC